MQPTAGVYVMAFMRKKPTKLKHGSVANTVMIGFMLLV